jgi:hypothetical protein
VAELEERAAEDLDPEPAPCKRLHHGPCGDRGAVGVVEVAGE